MALRSYDPQSTMREARAQYFEANHFGENGGYDEPWVDFKLGPIPIPFPNTPARVRAVRYHDLHHILTGYDTDVRGEFEIAAWEIAAGCKDFVAAWALNLAGVTGGVLLVPRRTWRAFVRGRRSRSLYGLPLGELLDSKVAETRQRMGVQETAQGNLTDAAAFALSVLAGVVVGTGFLLLAVPLSPLGIVSNWARQRSLQKAPAGSGS